MWKKTAKMHCAITAGFGSLRKNAQTPACKSDSDSDRDSDRVLSRGARKRGGGWGGARACCHGGAASPGGASGTCGDLAYAADRVVADRELARPAQQELGVGRHGDVVVDHACVTVMQRERPHARLRSTGAPRRGRLPHSARKHSRGEREAGAQGERYGPDDNPVPHGLVARLVGILAFKYLRGGARRA